jgi:hypothetical protein
MFRVRTITSRGKNEFRIERVWSKESKRRRMLGKTARSCDTSAYVSAAGKNMAGVGREVSGSGSDAGSGGGGGRREAGDDDESGGEEDEDEEGKGESAEAEVASVEECGGKTHSAGSETSRIILRLLIR